MASLSTAVHLLIGLHLLAQPGLHLLLGLHLLAQPGLAGLQGLETAYREVGQEEEGRDEMASFHSESEHEGRGRRDKRASFYRAGGDMAQQVSDTLDQLLVVQSYNKQMRPLPPGGGPVTVEINMAVRSIGPIDEVNNVFSLDCYFRQSWSDPRLRYNTTGIQQLALNWQFLTMIWRPDTVFINGQRCYLHKITTPNRFIRVYPDGKVSYSQRLTVWARCSMHLAKFPFDSQKCPLEIGSFGYHAGDVQYRWAESPLSLEPFNMAEVALTQFHHGVDTGPSSRKLASGFRNDSIAFLTFDFERQSGFFLLGIYFPLTLVVVCSWVAFWVVKTDTPSRVALGIITILSVTKIGFGGKAKPKVGYSTALDIYIILCFTFTFAALFEFVLINFIGLFIQRYKANEEVKKTKLAETKEQKTGDVTKGKNGHTEATEEDVKKKPSLGTLSACYRTMRSRLPSIPGLLMYEETQYVVDRIDEVARWSFPLAFITSSLGYWTYYLCLAQDMRAGPALREAQVSTAIL